LDTPEIVHHNPLAIHYPWLFPSHSTIFPTSIFQALATSIHIAFVLFKTFPKTLTHYVLLDNGSLWKLLELLAIQLGDLTRFKPYLQRHIERELFLSEFSKFELSAATQSAFVLEAAEYRLGRNTPPEIIQVKSNQLIREYRLGKFRLVNLLFNPTELYNDKPILDTKSLSKWYVLVYKDKRIRYYEVPKEFIKIFDKISTARNSRRTVNIEIELINEFLNLNILLPPEIQNAKISEEEKKLRDIGISRPLHFQYDPVGEYEAKEIITNMKICNNQGWVSLLSKKHGITLRDSNEIPK
jgi:hypothetical protein